MPTDTPACPPYLVMLENDRPDLKDITWIQLGAGCPDFQGSSGQLNPNAINVLGLRCPYSSKLRLQISFVGIYDILVPASGGGDVTLNISDVIEAGDSGQPLPNGWTVTKTPF